MWKTAGLVLIFGAIAWIGCGPTDEPGPANATPETEETIEVVVEPTPETQTQPAAAPPEEPADVERLVLDVAEMFLRSGDEKLASEVIFEILASKEMAELLDQVPTLLRDSASDVLTLSFKRQITENLDVTVGVSDILTNPTVNIGGAVTIKDEIDIPVIGTTTYTAAVQVYLLVDVASQTVTSWVPGDAFVTLGAVE